MHVRPPRSNAGVAWQTRLSGTSPNISQVIRGRSAPPRSPWSAALSPSLTTASAQALSPATATTSVLARQRTRCPGVGQKPATTAPSGFLGKKTRIEFSLKERSQSLLVLSGNRGINRDANGLERSDRPAVDAAAKNRIDAKLDEPVDTFVRSPTGCRQFCAFRDNAVLFINHQERFGTVEPWRNTGNKCRYGNFHGMDLCFNGTPDNKSKKRTKDFRAQRKRRNSFIGKGIE